MLRAVPAKTGIVEIEERDFYFEISPEDYQDEEANIRNNKKA